jgi:hypothetical protein
MVPLRFRLVKRFQHVELFTRHDRQIDEHSTKLLS